MTKLTQSLAGRSFASILVDESPDALIALSPEGTVLFWNSGAEGVFGYTAEEAVGRSIEDLTVPSDMREQARQMRAAVLVEGSLLFETTRRRKDGSFIDVAVSKRLVRDEAGQPLFIAVNKKDVTAIRESHKRALAASATRFQMLVEHSADGIVLTTVTGTLLYVSPAAARMFGRDAADLLGTSLRGYLHPDEVSSALERKRRLLEEPGRRHVSVYRLVQPDGTARSIEVVLTNLIDNPAIGAIVNNIRDVTERTLAEEALVVANQRFTALFESGIIGILVGDESGVVHEANDTFLALLGYTREDFAAGLVNWRNTTPPEWASWNAEATAELERYGRAKPREKEYFRKDRTRVPVLVGLAQMNAGQRISFSIDLTDRRRAADAIADLEKQFRQAQKMEAVGRLAGGVAHDFNNVLSVILSYGEMLLEDLEPIDPLRTHIEEIHKAGMRAADLTRQLLLFSRQQVLEPRVVDLNDVLASMDRMLQRILGADVDLVSLPTPALGRVRVDPTSVEQVIMNLVVNARDAMPTGGKLTMETANVVLDEAYAQSHLGVCAGRYVMLAVTDTGSGIEKETLGRIFEPFFTTKGSGKGTGLGLSTVFGVVQQSGGSIWVYSEVGKGTTFKIYLPRVDAVVDVVRSAEPPTTLRGSETILLVEDDDQVRVVARGILRRGGYNVIDAHNPGEALLSAEEYRGTIHLLLSDVVMPQMSGPALAKRLASMRPEMKVLCMSGYTDDSIVRHGVLDARIAFVQKPITPDALMAKVREVLDA